MKKPLFCANDFWNCEWNRFESLLEFFQINQRHLLENFKSIFRERIDRNSDMKTHLKLRVCPVYQFPNRYDVSARFEY